MKLKYDEPLPNFGLKFNLRRYSMAMFATAATANSFYGAAILMRASTWMLLINSVPWLLGRGYTRSPLSST